MVICQYIPENEWSEKPNTHLSIEVSEVNLRLLLQDVSDEKPLVLEEFSIEDSSIENCLKESVIYKNASPDTVRCAIINTDFTLIPSAIFKENSVKDYLDFNTKKKQDFILKSEKLIKYEIYNCYSFSKKLANSIESKFPMVLFKSLGSILIDKSNAGLSVNFSSYNTMEMSYVKQSKLIFHNSFTFANKDEMMYYISLAAEKLGVKLENETVNLSGEIDKMNDNFIFLKEFLPEKNLKFTTTDEKTKHKYYSLFKQIECV